MTKPREGITKLHIYEFDGCLFRTPIPSRDVVSTDVFQLLVESGYLSGGWYQWANVLKRTPRSGTKTQSVHSQHGQWNQDVVDLVKLSTSDQSTISVMITHRLCTEPYHFDKVIRPMLANESIRFDELYFNRAPNLYCEKSKNHKPSVLKILRSKYPNAKEVIIYESGVALPVHHTYLARYDQSLAELRAASPDVYFQVHSVANVYRNLLPITEWSIVDNAIRAHNSEVDQAKYNARKRQLLGRSYNNDKKEAFVSFIPRIKHEVCYQILPKDLPRVSKYALNLWESSEEHLDEPFDEDEVKGKPQFLGDRIRISERPITVEHNTHMTWRITAIMQEGSYIMGRTEPDVTVHGPSFEVPGVDAAFQPTSLVLLDLSTRSVIDFDTYHPQEPSVWKELPEDRQISFETVLLKRQFYDVDEKEEYLTEYGTFETDNYDTGPGSGIIF